MISKDEMFDPILETDPSFRPKWERFVNDYQDESDKPLYLALSELAQHLIGRLRQRETNGIREIFATVERWHVEGDTYVSEAATVGFLESLQNSLGGQKPNRPERELLAEIEGYLGPESARWWNKLYRFWDGDTKALRFDT